MVRYFEENAKESLGNRLGRQAEPARALRPPNLKIRGGLLIHAPAGCHRNDGNVVYRARRNKVKVNAFWKPGQPIMNLLIVKLLNNAY